MPVTDVSKDLDAMTMTITAEFEAGAERIWEMWSDPRQLERWWGPPSFPATFVEHDLTPGGRTAYFMTGPEGAEAPRLVADRGDRAAQAAALHRRLRRRRGQSERGDARTVERDRHDHRGRGRHDDVDRIQVRQPRGMEEMIEMGMEQGMVEALSQIDALLVGERA